MGFTEPSVNQEETQFYKTKLLVIRKSSEWRKFGFWSLGGYPRIHPRSFCLYLLNENLIQKNTWEFLEG